MSCHVYRVGSPLGNCGDIRFSDTDDLSCLCTFPANYTRGKDVSLGTVRSLAMLGAAVVLLYEREIIADMDGDVCLPAAIPDWIREAIYQLTEEKI